jgi:hypothetical protein
MHVFFRFVLYVTVLVGGVVGVAYAQPAWLEDLGLDFWCLPELRQALVESQDRAEELDSTWEKMTEAHALKEETLNQLIAQKISLTEAAGQIMDASESLHLDLAIEVCQIKGENQDWTSKRLGTETVQAKLVRARLEEELEDFLASKE